MNMDGLPYYLGTEHLFFQIGDPLQNLDVRTVSK